jgi:hypothetical protein
MSKEDRSSTIEKLGARRSYNNKARRSFGCGKNTRAAKPKQKKRN